MILDSTSNTHKYIYIYKCIVAILDFETFIDKLISKYFFLNL